MFNVRTLVFAGSVLVSVVLLAMFAGGYFNNPAPQTASVVTAAPIPMRMAEQGDGGDDDQGTEVQQSETDEQNNEQNQGDHDGDPHRL